MDQQDEKKHNTSLDDRCGYERCEHCPLFEFCETCYNEVCLLERCNQFCGRCPVTCHDNPDSDFEEIDLHKLKVDNPTQGIDLPAGWYPTVRNTPILKEIPLKAVFVKFEEIYNFRSGLMRTLDPHDFFGLPKTTKMILTFNVPDRILEKIWLTFINKTFRLIIKGLKIDYVCTPNFSNFFDTPRYQYWKNIWRSVVMSNEIHELGYKLIFDVSSPVPATHRYYVDLIRRSGIKCICFNCQTLKLKRYKERAYQRFEELNKLPKDVDFIITGLCSAKQAPRSYEILKGRKIIFTSSSPFLKAICRSGLDGHSTVDAEPLLLMKTYFKHSEDIHKELNEKYSKRNSPEAN